MKRKEIALVLIISLFFLAMAGTADIFNVGATDLSVDDWPMFMHDPHRSGTPDNIAPINNSMLWRFDVDMDPLGQAVRSSAAIVGGVVYTASQNSYVYALDAYNGTCYWRYSLLGMGTLSSPAVVDGVVYIGSAYGVFAINATTGVKIWQSPSILADISSPAVTGGTVYIGSFAEDSIYAFRVSDGQQVWSYTAGNYVVSSPAVVGDVVYICSDDGYLYALDASTGALVWKFSCLAYMSLHSSPAVANGVVYVTSDYGNVFAVNASSGNSLWNYTTADLPPYVYSPAYNNGVVYISTGRGIYALNASSGQKIWNSTTVSPSATPAIVEGVVCLAGNGNIYALDALTGAKIWQYEIGSSIRSSPAVAGGVVYFGTDNGSIYAIGTPVPPIPEFQNPIMMVAILLAATLTMAFELRWKKQ